MDSDPRGISGALGFSVTGERHSRGWTTDSSRNLENSGEERVEENENDFGSEMGYSIVNLEYLDSFTRDQSVKKVEAGLEHESAERQNNFDHHDHGIRRQELCLATSTSGTMEPITNANLHTSINHVQSNEGTTEPNKLESIQTNLSKLVEMIGKITVETERGSHKFYPTRTKRNSQQNLKNEGQ